MRTKGSKDLKPRSRRRTKGQVITDNVKEDIKNELLKDYVLLPRDLFELLGISEEALIKILVYSALTRFNELTKKYE